MSTDTVTVGCKLPNGLILRSFEMRDVHEPVLGGGSRKVKQAAWTGEEFKINGFAAPAGMHPKAEMATGFALTHGVPKDLWDSWLAANKASDLVKNGLIFAHAEPASVKDQAKDHRALKSGLEPINPNKLPERKIQMADESAKPEAFDEDLAA